MTATFPLHRTGGPLEFYYSRYKLHVATISKTNGEWFLYDQTNTVVGLGKLVAGPLPFEELERRAEEI